MTIRDDIAASIERAERESGLPPLPPPAILFVGREAWERYREAGVIKADGTLTERFAAAYPQVKGIECVLQRMTRVLAV